MILQNLRVPEPHQCLDTRAYCLSSPADISCFNEGDILDLTSFFNCFSMNKWSGYTDIRDFRLKLIITGRFKIEIISDLYSVIYDDVADGDCYEWETSLNENAQGLLSVRLTALSQGSSFIGGYFFTNEPKTNAVRLALDVCTYRRESYVSEKIKKLKESFDEFGNDYPLAIEMYIIDNAGTFTESIEDERIHIFKNRNCGGSGGYARGIYEIRKSGRFTHAVFVDDDTYLDFESVYRLFSLLSYIKDEWKDSLIGGAMMRSESPTVVYETSAFMDLTNELLNDSEVDVSDPESLLSLNKSKHSNYNGWWFCCTPHLDGKDYPAPMFVAYDDVEYGARFNKEVIIMNGISVWHDPFDSKYSVARYYYDYRNMMMARAMNGKMSYGLLFKVLYHSALEALYTRYETSDILLRAMYDFFKGPYFIESIDPEKLNSELGKIGRLSPVSELSIGFDRNKYDASISKMNCKRTYVRSILTLNGILLPSKYDVVAPLKVKKASVFYRAKRVLHCDKDGKRGFVTEIDKKRALKRIFSIPFLFIKYSFRLKKVSRRYVERSDYLRSEEFWVRYLGLN